MMSSRRIVGLGLLVMLVGTACGLSSLSAPQEGGSAQPTAAEPAGPPMVPVSINEGLASLDSYRMTYTSDVFDSVTQERTATTFVVAHDGEADADYTRTETRVTSEGEDVASEDVQEQYAIAHQLCSIADGEAEMTAISETAQVMSDLMSRVVVFQPLIENPVYVGDEVVNGVASRTYTFEVRSVAATSDVEATRADGTYAIAADGDYLVHYRLDMELRTGAEGDPEAESTVFFIEVSLEDVNQPVDIAFPPSCQQAGSSAE